MDHDPTESRRAREFYRYYEPIRTLSESGPTFYELGDAAAEKAHMPCSSPDKALTAFCQLGALRLGTRRSMLFFFDESYAYILAEATRTLSLQDDSKHDIDDSLWLGHTVIPRGFSICEHTVRMDISGLAQVDDPPQIHIINDLLESTQFCDRPFVTGGPKARFYAGVPITTPNGINIGAYCVLDDKPRDGLSRQDITFLREMSSTIMTHLNMARAKDEQRRGLKMVHALSTFVDESHGVRGRSGHPVQRSSDRLDRHQSSSTMPTNATQPEHIISTDTPATAAPITSSPRHASPRDPKSSRVRSVDAVTRRTSASRGVTSAVTGIQQSDHSHHDGTHRAPLPENHLPGSTTHDYGVHSVPEDPIPSNVQITFQTAAELVRAATEVDGTLFLKVSGGIFSGLTHTDPRDLSSSTLSKSDNESSTPEIAAIKIPTRQCSILGSSGTVPEIRMTNVFLSSLLERYKKGKIWSFDKSLAGSSGDETTDQPRSRNDVKITEEPSAARKLRQDERRKTELEEIQRLFPGVRGFAIHGLLDETNGRWYAACMTWTYSPLRVFSASEMNYIAVFCDVIMAEVKRQEVQASDRAKTDFISSISHELRSPLHGILGSVECMQDEADPMSESKELAQIETCGRTLLDIVDHLLDASMINSNKPKATTGLTRFRKPRQSTPKESDATFAGLRGHSEDVSLAKITEETVDTVIYALSCRKEKQELLNRNVTVDMRIDDFDGPRWNVHIPTGAYRRIVMNLVSNALKYTHNGFVSISLRAVELLDDKHRFNAVLEVCDSGCGMSQVYLQNSAFRAFSQEDSFVEGTGLGLNLVVHILKQLGGKIDVQSEKNVGTQVKVTLPLTYSSTAQTGTTARTSTADDAAYMNTNLNPSIKEGIMPPTSRDNPAASPTPLSPPGIQHDSSSIVGPDAPAPGLSSSDTTSSDSVQNPGTVSAQSLSGLVENKALQTSSISDKACRPLIGIVLDDPLRASNPDLAGIIRADNLIETSIHYTCSQMGFRIHAGSARASSDTDLEIMTELAALQLVQAALAGVTRSPIRGGPVIIVTRTAQSERMIKARPAFAEALTTGHIEYVRSYWVIGLAEAIRRCLSKKAIPTVPVQHISTLTENQTGLEVSIDHSHPLEAIPTVPTEAEPSDLSAVATAVQALSIEPPLATTKEINDLNKSIPEKNIKKEKSGSQNDLCLLIVDDNPINLQILATYARKQGHPHLKAVNGEEAVNAYKKAYVPEDKSRSPKHKIILLDINMPVMDGYSAARQIRDYEHKHSLHPATIIALTGLGSAAAQQDAFDSGMDLFLTKPVSLKALKRVIGDVQAGSLR